MLAQGYVTLGRKQASSDVCVKHESSLCSTGSELRRPKSSARIPRRAREALIEKNKHYLVLRSITESNPSCLDHVLPKQQKPPFYAETPPFTRRSAINGTWRTWGTSQKWKL